MGGQVRGEGSGGGHAVRALSRHHSTTGVTTVRHILIYDDLCGLILPDRLSGFLNLYELSFPADMVSPSLPL